MIRLVIDTDPGVDDAHALMAALAHPGARIDALTTVVGNVPLECTTANACAIADAMDADVPIFAGCAHPLIGPPSHATEFHGGDGLGDSGLPRSTREVEREHGVCALMRLANEAPGERTLVAIGPLTNVALATRLDPELPRKYANLVVMGGAIRGMGNATPAAEFNIRADPEAAAIVFGGWPGLTLVSWETTMAHPFTPSQVEALLAVDTPRGEFFRRISQNTLAFVERFLNQRLMLEPDLLAAAVALEPSLVDHAKSHYVDIELAGEKTRGQTTVDWFDRTGETANARLVLELNTERVWEMMMAALVGT
jgi:purine nucleosidase